MSGAGAAPRREDLDWLRVIAFGLLIYFHAAIAFLPDGIPMIQNTESSVLAEVGVAFLHQFRLGLLFLVSGVGVCYAMKRRNKVQFLRDRSIRLLIPLAFGVLVLVPPMVFLEKRFIGEFGGSLFEFYPLVFTTGVYPTGNLSWHHFWFIAYLYLFCLLGLPLFGRLRESKGIELSHRFSNWLIGGRRLYLAILPLALIEIALRAPFPGFRDLIHDWASFAHWFALFVAGFLFAANLPLLERAAQLRGQSLLLAAGTTLLLFGFFWSPDLGSLTPFRHGPVEASSYVLFCVLRIANIWFWLLTCLGYAGRYLRRGSRVLKYLNDAVYPLFCLHLPVIAALDYLLLPLGWPSSLKYLMITSLTVLICLLAYERIRRVRWLRPLFGLKSIVVAPVLAAPLSNKAKVAPSDSRRLHASTETEL